jgi:hypothetical protein
LTESDGWTSTISMLWAYTSRPEFSIDETVSMSPQKPEVWHSTKVFITDRDHTPNLRLPWLSSEAPSCWFSQCRIDTPGCRCHRGAWSGHKWHPLLRGSRHLHSNTAHHHVNSSKRTPCSAELISTAYQPWNSVFLSQQISHSRLISQKTACRTGPKWNQNPTTEVLNPHHIL